MLEYVVLPTVVPTELLSVAYTKDVCCQYVLLHTAVPTELLPVANTHDVCCQYSHSAASNREKHRCPTRIKAQKGSRRSTPIILEVSTTQRSA